MSEPLLLDPAHISGKPLVMEGRFLAAELERLADDLAEGGGELRYRITAVLDRQRRRTVSCIIEGFVFLTCQVSLEAFRHDISISDRLVLVDDESGLPPMEVESETEDYLVADGPLDIRDLIEDAVLLALPMMPRKPGLGAGAAAAPAPPGGDSPFAALAGLKKRK